MDTRSLEERIAAIVHNRKLADRQIGLNLLKRKSRWAPKFRWSQVTKMLWPARKGTAHVNNTGLTRREWRATVDPRAHHRNQG
jgi:hypothetical protein